MKSRLFILISLGLLAAFAVAVQHETFLRRCLLPKRELPPTLARRIGDFRVERVAFPEAVIAVGKAAGKPVNFSESGSRVIEPMEPVTIELRDATVEDAVCALLVRTSSPWGVFLKDTPNAIVVCDRDPGPTSAAGAYQISSVRMPAATRPARDMTREELLEEFRLRVPGYSSSWLLPAGLGGPEPVQLFGDHVIILTDPMSRRLISDWLAEKRGR